MFLDQLPLQKSLEITVTCSNSNGSNIYTIYGSSMGKQIFLGVLVNAVHPLPIVMTKSADTKVKLTTLNAATCRSKGRRR